MREALHRIGTSSAGELGMLRNLPRSFEDCVESHLRRSRCEQVVTMRIQFPGKPLSVAACGKHNALWDGQGCRKVQHAFGSNGCGLAILCLSISMMT